MATIIPQLRDRASLLFRAHTGAAVGTVDHYAVTPWRQWLLTSVGCGIWFAVPKNNPTAKPKAFICSLAQAKANLLAGN